jgi:hypothetical protein
MELYASQLGKKNAHGHDGWVEINFKKAANNCRMKTKTFLKLIGFLNFRNHFEIKTKPEHSGNILIIRCVKFAYYYEKKNALKEKEKVKLKVKVKSNLKEKVKYKYNKKNNISLNSSFSPNEQIAENKNLEIQETPLVKLAESETKISENIETPSQKKNEVLKNFCLQVEEKIYKNYPRKVGKQNGLKKLARTLASGEAQIADMAKALASFCEYHRSNRTDSKFLPHFSTWATSWRDWLDPDAGKVSKDFESNGGFKVNWDFIDGKNSNTETHVIDEGVFEDSSNELGG